MIDIGHVDAKSVVERRVEPVLRCPQSSSEFHWPSDVVVVSTDNHISISEDIFYERFPEHLKDRAPRVWREDPLWHIGFGGKSLMPDPYRKVCMVTDAVVGGFDVAARMEDLKAEGVDKEIVFPNLLLAMLFYPDAEIKSLTYEVYNDWLAEQQERAPGFFYGVGLVDHTRPADARAQLQRIKDIGLKTYMLPLNAGRFADGREITYASPEMEPFWQAAEDVGLPVCFHIGESLTADGRGAAGTRILQNFAPFRGVVGQLVFGGILDRHPNLKIVFAEGGINWLPAARQDAHWIAASCEGLDWELQHDPAHYWERNFYSCFMEDPLGIDWIDEVGVGNAMWSMDYPHSEGTFGSGRSQIVDLIDKLGLEKAKKILGGNAIELFDL